MRSHPQPVALPQRHPTAVSTPTKAKPMGRLPTTPGDTATAPPSQNSPVFDQPTAPMGVATPDAVTKSPAAAGLAAKERIDVVRSLVPSLMRARSLREMLRAEASDDPSRAMVDAARESDREPSKAITVMFSSHDHGLGINFGIEHNIARVSGFDAGGLGAQHSARLPLGAVLVGIQAASVEGLPAGAALAVLQANASTRPLALTFDVGATTPAGSPVRDPQKLFHQSPEEAPPLPADEQPPTPRTAWEAQADRPATPPRKVWGEAPPPTQQHHQREERVAEIQEVVLQTPEPEVLEQRSEYLDNTWREWAATKLQAAERRRQAQWRYNAFRCGAAATFIQAVARGRMARARAGVAWRAKTLSEMSRAGIQPPPPPMRPPPPPARHAPDEIREEIFAERADAPTVQQLQPGAGRSHSGRTPVSAERQEQMRQHLKTEQQKQVQLEVHRVLMEELLNMGRWEILKPAHARSTNEEQVQIGAMMASDNARAAGPAPALVVAAEPEAEHADGVKAPPSSPVSPVSPTPPAPEPASFFSARGGAPPRSRSERFAVPARAMGPARKPAERAASEPVMCVEEEDLPQPLSHSPQPQPAQRQLPRTQPSQIEQPQLQPEPQQQQVHVQAETSHQMPQMQVSSDELIKREANLIRRFGCSSDVAGESLRRFGGHAGQAGLWIQEQQEEAQQQQQQQQQQQPAQLSSRSEASLSPQTVSPKMSMSDMGRQQQLQREALPAAALLPARQQQQRPKSTDATMQHSKQHRPKSADANMQRSALRTNSNGSNIATGGASGNDSKVKGGMRGFGMGRSNGMAATGPTMAPGMAMMSQNASRSTPQKQPHSARAALSRGSMLPSAAGGPAPMHTGGTRAPALVSNGFSGGAIGGNKGGLPGSGSSRRPMGSAMGSAIQRPMGRPSSASSTSSSGSARGADGADSTSFPSFGSGSAGSSSAGSSSSLLPAAAAAGSSQPQRMQGMQQPQRMQGIQQPRQHQPQPQQQRSSAGQLPMGPPHSQGAGNLGSAQQARMGGTDPRSGRFLQHV